MSTFPNSLLQLARLFWRLLRYRVAIMLTLFLLLGAASAGRIENHLWPLILAAIALAAGYVSATSSNDLADQAIDAINHAGHSGRPLVSGEATRTQIWQLFAIASALAIGLVFPLGPTATAIMATSILINVAYSLPPLRLSYRTWLAPLVLAIGYVGVPFALGVVTTTTHPTSTSWWLAAACYALFVGRIVLKDFRDRAGDAKYGKPTLLLAHGKTVTISVSVTLVLLGLGLLWLARPVSPTWLLIAPTALFGAVLFQAYRLQIAPQAAEQLIIGAGAKLGNSALLTLLGLMLLEQSGASEPVQVLFASFMLALTMYGFIQLTRSPQAAINAYRG